jgi:hypothetical protein
LDELKHLKNNFLKTKKYNINNRVQLIKDFISICNLYGIEFEIFVGNNTCSYDFYDQVLTMTTESIFYSIREQVKIFCHGLAHHIQYLTYTNIDEYFRTYEKNLKFEREAERLAYFVAKNHFSLKLHHSEFSCYKSKRDKEFLKKYFEMELQFELA